MDECRQPAIYIMANKRNGTLYVGVTSDLIQRVYQHKQDETDGFTKRYGCKILVYYEQYDNMETAIEREKQLKGGSRKKKIALIESVNPKWADLYKALL
jgi:predicted GIY-YIG superfamily endonuclease